MSKYKYEIWKNILTKLEFGKEYTVNDSREDYDEFVDALKSFSHNWWNFIVRHQGASVTFVLLDPIKTLDETISSMEKWESSNLSIKSESEIKSETICDRAYDPDEKIRKEKFWEEKNKEKMANEAKLAAQSNDLPSTDTLYHPEKDNASTGLKQGQNKTNKNEESTEW